MDWDAVLAFVLCDYCPLMVADLEGSVAAVRVEGRSGGVGCVVCHAVR